jgi:transcriptional regulator with XRE-family HTH domain
MKTTLAERLKEARTLRGLTQKALGDLVGVSQAAIQKIETGKANQTTKLVELANALMVKPEWLSSGVGPMRSDAKESNIGPESEWELSTHGTKTHRFLLTRLKCLFLRILNLRVAMDAFNARITMALSSGSQRQPSDALELIQMGLASCASLLLATVWNP